MSTSSCTARRAWARPHRARHRRGDGLASTSPPARCSRAPQTLVEVPHTPERPRRALHRRDPPAPRRRRRVHLPRDGGLPHRRQGRDGLNARTVQIPLKPFALIGHATTRAGRSRSPARASASPTPLLRRRGTPHDPPPLLLTVLGRRRRSGAPGTKGVRGARDDRVPPAARRIANRLLRRVRDYAQVKGDGSLTARMVKGSSRPEGVDDAGLDELDRSYLPRHRQGHGGGPVGSKPSPPRSTRTPARSRTSSSPSCSRRALSPAPGARTHARRGHARHAPRPDPVRERRGRGWRHRPLRALKCPVALCIIFLISGIRGSTPCVASDGKFRRGSLPSQSTGLVPASPKRFPCSRRSRL